MPARASAVDLTAKKALSAVLADQGGADQCSESRLQLVRRFAAAAVLAEQMEGEMANGAKIDINEHTRLSLGLVRLAQRIGIDRIARDITSAVLDANGKPRPARWTPLSDRLAEEAITEVEVEAEPEGAAQ